MTFMCLIEDIISQIATFGVFQCNFHALCLQLLGYFFATNAHPSYTVHLDKFGIYYIYYVFGVIKVIYSIFNH